MSKNTIDKDWIIGFSEGEGSWFKRANASRGFEIGQDKSDSQILYRIKETLGFGKVYHNSKTELSRYVMLKEQEDRIFDFYNQHFRMKKTLARFQLWAEDWPDNKRPLLLQQEVKIENSLADSAWLSGFIDAKGCFRVTEEKGRGKIIFEISQNDYEILERIAKFLKLKRNIRLDRNCYVLATSSKDSRSQLIRYLKKYPLKTKKKIDFDLWVKAHNLAILGELKGEKLKNIRRRINKKVKGIVPTLVEAKEN